MECRVRPYAGHGWGKDMSKTVDAWKAAINAGQNVMSLQPPASEKEQQALGQFFYKSVFLQYSNLSPVIHQPDSLYVRVSEKLASLTEKKEFTPLIETILSFSIRWPSRIPT